MDKNIGSSCEQQIQALEMTDFLVKNKLEQIVENFKVGHMYFYQYPQGGNDIKGVVFSK